MPEDGTGKKRLVMSVNGQLYLFTDLAADGLTFTTRVPLNIPNPGRNRMKGQQEIAVNVPEPVRYIRVGNDGNGMGNLRDSFLHIVTFQALDAAGKNWATLGEGVQIKKLNKETVSYYQVQNPEAMFTPGNAPSDEQPNFTSFGYYIGPAVITLKQPVALKTIRFLLSDREQAWYRAYWPFYWQGKLYRQGAEQGEPWYNYTVEVSADEQQWVTVVDRFSTEMMRSCPEMVDWDGDGKIDLLLGVLNSKGIWPNHVVYRLYRNTGTNDRPLYTTYEPLCDENGKPLQVNANWYTAYAPQCGVVSRDLNGDGKRDLVVEYGNRLVSYLHVGENPRALTFKRGGMLGDNRAIDYPASYRYFAVDDVDGDGTLDLINSASAQMVLFRGLKPGETTTLPPDAPPAPPFTRTVLQAAEACTLDAQQPDAVYPATPSALEARAPGKEKQKVILLRVKNIPKLAALERATLELTTDPALQKEGEAALQGLATLAISCNSIRDDWDAAAATFHAAKPGVPWAKDELDAGGVFLSKAPLQFTVQPRRTLRWDVTAAVREALRQGRASVSLLVRVDYTGYYIGG
ncbi:MAG TPA: VCBS repeat-containing protein, partial [Armatimonadota bacterium]|nr:VCBS repeat-containing protein [Armatimonadota bacterium]